MNAQQELFNYAVNKSKLTVEEEAKYNRYLNHPQFTDVALVGINPLKQVVVNNKISVNLTGHSCPIEFEYKNSSFGKEAKSWFGYVEDTTNLCLIGEFQSFNDVEKGRYGSIQINDDVYEFMPISDVYNVLYRYVPIEIVNDCAVGDEKKATIKPAAPTETGITSEDKSETPCYGRNRVDVLVLFTQAADDIDPDIEARARLAFQQSRLALRNSRVAIDDLELRLIGVLPTTFMEDDPRISRDIEAVSDPASDPALQRDAQGADVVLVLTNNDYIDGAGVVADIGPSTDDAFALVTVGAATFTKTFSHELGHLLGGRHNIDINGTIEHGYVFRVGPFWPFTNRRGTIMATLRSIGGTTRKAARRRITYYSNPDISYRGKRIGTELRNDNAEHFRSTGTLVANFIPNVDRNFNAWITAPWEVCPCESQVFRGFHTCADGNVDYFWETSTNGVTWEARSTTDVFDFIPPCGETSLTTIRLTVTDGTTTVVNGRTVGANPDSYYCGKSLSTKKLTTAAKNTKTSGIITFPNPAKSTEDINIIVGRDVQEMELYLSDLNGRLLSRNEYQNVSSGQVLKVIGGAVNISPGIYLVQVIMDGEKTVQQLVVVP